MDVGFFLRRSVGNRDAQLHGLAGQRSDRAR